MTLVLCVCARACARAITPFQIVYTRFCTKPVTCVINARFFFKPVMLIMFFFLAFHFENSRHLDIHVRYCVCVTFCLSECVPRICTTWLMWPEQAWIALACTMWSIIRIVQSHLRLVTQFAVWKVYWITLRSLKVSASLIPKVAIGHDSKPVGAVGGTWTK